MRKDDGSSRTWHHPLKNPVIDLVRSDEDRSEHSADPAAYSL